MTVLQAEHELHLEKTYNLSVANLPAIGRAADRLVAEAAFGEQHLGYFETRYDASLQAIWCYLRPPGRPVFTQGLVDELLVVHDQLRSAYAIQAEDPTRKFSFVVFGSRSPGVFNLGGDLATFARCVRAGDRASIHRYAHGCVDIVYENTQALHLPIVTVGLVQGDALGGGFESALSFDVLVAERSARFCLPEVLFNLFPGMGAYSLLTRKVGPVLAERIISGGSMQTAEELYRMGIVDVLAEDGQGEAAVAAYIRKESTRLNARLAMNAARRRVNPITHDELRDVVDIWTDAVFGLSELNLRKMDRLVSAQTARVARQ